MGSNRRALETLSIYEALARAMERRREMFEVVQGSPDPDAAAAGVQQLLGIDKHQARAVLDMQVRRFTARDQARIVEERDRLRALVKSSDPR